MESVRRPVSNNSRTVRKRVGWGYPYHTLHMYVLTVRASLRRSSPWQHTAWFILLREPPILVLDVPPTPPRPCTDASAAELNLVNLPKKWLGEAGARKVQNEPRQSPSIPGHQGDDATNVWRRAGLDAEGREAWTTRGPRAWSWGWWGLERGLERGYHGVVCNFVRERHGPESRQAGHAAEESRQDAPVRERDVESGDGGERDRFG